MLDPDPVFHEWNPTLDCMIPSHKDAINGCEPDRKGEFIVEIRHPVDVANHGKGTGRLIVCRGFAITIRQSQSETITCPICGYTGVGNDIIRVVGTVMSTASPGNH